MNNPNTPAIIPIPGMSVRKTIVDETDHTERFDLTMNFQQFIDGCKHYTDHEGFLKMEIVKRRKPSPTGHTHIIRLKRTLPEKAETTSNVIE